MERQYTSINGQSMTPKAIQANGLGQVFMLSSTQNGLHSGALLNCTDEAGNPIWTLRMELPSGGLVPSSMILSGNGDLYVLGTVYNPNGQLYIAKVDQSGNLNTTQTLNTDFAFVAQNLYEKDGRLFILADIQANYMGTLWIGAVIQLDEYLNLVNTTQLSYHSFTSFHSIAEDEDGNLILTGAASTSNNGRQGLVVKMNPNFDILWSRIASSNDPSYGRTILSESFQGHHRVLIETQGELFAAHFNTQGILTSWQWVGNGESYGHLEVPGVGTYVVSPQNSEIILLDNQSNVLSRQTWNNNPTQITTKLVLLDQQSLAVLAASHTYPQEIVYKRSDDNFHPGCLGDYVNYYGRGAEVPFSSVTMNDHHLSIISTYDDVRVWLADSMSFQVICGKE